MNEIEEFYSYIEMPQVAENLKAYEGSFTGSLSARHLSQYSLTRSPDWTTAPVAKRKAYVDFLLEGLEHRDVEIRFTNARRLFYVLQGQCPSAPTSTLTSCYPGTFAEAENPEGQLRWIFENCLLVRSADGVSKIVEALKIAGHKHDLLWSVHLVKFQTSLIRLQQHLRRGCTPSQCYSAGKVRPNRRSVDRGFCLSWNAIPHCRGTQRPG